VLRGVEDTRWEGSRRPSLADAVKEALGVVLPKISQLSPWWRDRLTQEQIEYAPPDAVCSNLRLRWSVAAVLNTLGPLPGY
jgi:ribonuclease D